MDPTLAAFVSIGSSIVAALFGVVTLMFRQQREDLKSAAADWRMLYEKEASAHNVTREKASENQFENSAALREVAAFLHTTAERRAREDAELRDHVRRERPIR